MYACVSLSHRGSYVQVQFLPDAPLSTRLIMMLLHCVCQLRMCVCVFVRGHRSTLSGAVNVNVHINASEITTDDLL